MLTTSGLQILHIPVEGGLTAEFSDVVKNDSYQSIYENLQQAWSSNEIPWDSINKTIFDVRAEIGPDVPIAVMDLLRGII